jgi:hypothetical protein
MLILDPTGYVLHFLIVIAALTVLFIVRTILSIILG